MKNLLLLLSLPLWLFSQNSQLQNLLQKVNPQGFTGFILYDSQNKNTLYQENASKYFLPASNEKIVTFYHVYHTLKDSIPALKYVYRNDSLYVKPFGDPTFLDDRFSSTNVEKLLKYTKAKVIAIDFSLNINSYAAGWSMEDFDQEYMPERSAWPMYGNILTSSNKQFFSFQKLNSTNRKTYSNVFNSTAYKVPFIVSNELNLNMLSHNYSKKFVETTFPNVDFQIIYSNPKQEVLKEMMQESDNFIAEQLGIVSANYLNISLEHYKDSIINSFKSCPLENSVSSIRKEDFSGLSRYDLISPNDLLFELIQIQNTIPDYLSYFPLNGFSGSLAHNYQRETGFIYAKTGTMSGVYCLSGYLKTDSGRLLLFSLMNNNFRVKVKTLKPQIEELLLYIKHNY